jgi:glycosyltransferase involved in cell wall biosynthesis
MSDKRALVVRYDGAVFAIRMSKVLESLRDSGFTVDIAVPEGQLNMKVNVSAEMGRDLSKEVDLHLLASSTKRKISGFPVRLAGLPEIWDPLFEKSIKTLAQKNSYSLIVCKDTKALAMVFRATDAVKNKIPVICDMYENCIYQLRDKWINFGNWKTKLRYRIMRTEQRLRSIESKYLPLCERTFVVVEEARDYLLEQYPHLDPESIKVVHNIEQLSRFDAIPRGNLPEIANSGIVFSYVGSVRSHRGIDFIINAIELVSKAECNPFKVVIVGAREEKKQEIIDMIGQRGLGNYFVIKGFLTHIEAMQWIKATDVGLVPHKDTPFIRTTIPNKIFQYMAAGASVIVSDIPPLNRIVNEENCGYAVDTYDARKFADVILRVIKNDSEWKKFGKNGRKACEMRYDWDKESASYRDFFKKIPSC